MNKIQIPPAPTPKEVLTALEIQAILGVSKRTIDRLVKTGRLPCIQASPGGKRLFPKAVVEALLALKSPPAAPLEPATATPAGDQP